MTENQDIYRIIISIFATIILFLAILSVMNYLYTNSSKDFEIAVILLLVSILGIELQGEFKR